MSKRPPLRMRGLWAAAILALYVAGALLLTGDTWHSPTTRWIGSCCDPEQAIWFLGWVPYAIGHGINPLITHRINYPAGVNLMWNTPVFVAGVLAAPITVVGGAILAYNVALISGIAASAWCAYLALRRYASGMIAPIVGGAVYGFSPYVIPQAVLHLPQVIAVGPPLFLLVLDEVLCRRRRSPLLLGVALGAIATMQLLIAEEPLAIAAIFAAVLVVTLALQRRSAVPQAWPRLAEALVWATLTFVVLAAVPLSVQFFGAQRIHGAVQNVDTFSTDLLNLVLPTRFQLISPRAATLISDRFSGLTHEANAYVGVPLLLLLVAYCARHWDDVTTRIAAIVAAVAFILTLGPHLHIGAVSTGWPLPWLAASGIPLAEDILPSRMAVVGWLATAVLVTLAMDAASRGGWRRTVPRLGAIAISLIAVLPAPLQSSTTNVPAFFRNWSREGIPGGSVVMVAPFFRDGAGADPMIWSAAAGIEFSMPEAYAYVPQADGKPGYGPPATQLSDVMEAIQDKGMTVITGGEVRAQIARDLKAKDIRDVIVGPMEHHQQMVEFFTNLFGRPPEHTDGVDLWRDVDRNGVSGP